MLAGVHSTLWTLHALEQHKKAFPTTESGAIGLLVRPGGSMLAKHFIRYCVHRGAVVAAIAMQLLKFPCLPVLLAEVVYPTVFGAKVHHIVALRG